MLGEGFLVVRFWGSKIAGAYLSNKLGSKWLYGVWCGDYGFKYIKTRK